MPVAAPVPRTQKGRRHPSGRTVLLADGDARTLDGTRRFLLRHGFEVETATGGVECFGKLRRLTNPILVLDFELLWGGGDGVLALLKEHPTLAQTPVVLTASDRLEECVCRNLPGTVRRVLPKPIDQEILLHILHNICPPGRRPRGSASCEGQAITAHPVRPPEQRTGVSPSVPGFAAGGPTETEDEALVRVDVDGPPRANPPPPRPPGVLVVDDDDLVRGVLRSGLGRHGFRVWVAAGGAEAVAVYREHAAAIDVVLLDVCMPGMDGPDTLDALRGLNGDVAACFLSGDTGGYEPDAMLRRGARRLLSKPVGLEEVAAALRSVVRDVARPAPAGSVPVAPAGSPRTIAETIMSSVPNPPTLAGPRPRAHGRPEREWSPRRPENPVPLRVLVIDGDADARATFRRVLHRAGGAAETVETAEVALDRAGRGPYGAIILDNRLPGRPIADVLPRFRDGFPDTPVLVSIRQTDAAAAGQVLRLGAADYLLKPIDPVEVLARLGRIAQYRQAREAVRAADAARQGVEAEMRQTAEELRATTRQLWQAARLAGIGELAASIAHELNNPLGTVGLRVEGLLTRTPPDDPRRHSLEVIDEEVDRMGKLVGNLLGYSRSGTGVSTVDVRDEVTQTLELIAHHLRKSQVHAGPEFEPGVPLVHADRQQLRQVLLNLFTNAVDAMPNGGRLIPRVRPGRLADGRPAVVMEVGDTGCGIPADVLPRVTEPFFTTKEEGKGTGLGLSVCKQLVEGHQGTLEVESTLGAGTTVRVMLPARPVEPGDEARPG